MKAGGGEGAPGREGVRDKHSPEQSLVGTWKVTRKGLESVSQWEIAGPVGIPSFTWREQRLP